MNLKDMLIFSLIFCILTLSLMLAYVIKKALKKNPCLFGRHTFPDRKYYCTHCKEGRGTLRVIDGEQRFKN